jgi:acetyl/propionyl-CoA carboxylase alpha subunit
VFKKVLIANRGEIACRIAGALQEMGIVPVAVYSEADRGARHVRMAGEAYEIGPADPRASYLNMDRLIETARAAGAQAIHPGYGFLSENAAFSGAVEAAGLTFIGPTAEQARTMGDKRAARRVAEAAGVPIVPGFEGRGAKALAAGAKKLGYPVIVKAALGGGGKGMRRVDSDSELREAVESAERLATASFGDASVYLEKCIERPRHVEVQVFGDGKGGAVHLFERECSLQRRHQKVIEECPSPAVDEALRARMTGAAVALARQVKYRGAGTVEFLLAPDGAFYFLEMNTRLQVEHPVTERVTGIDLVRLQIEVAATGTLPFEQDAIVRSGHAIEARVYAEDAASGFLPQAGTASRVEWPSGPFTRVDAGIESGDAVPVHYDPILAKVITHGPDRAAAITRLAGALDATLIHGVLTNLPFLRALLHDDAVRAAAVDTEWIEREFLARFQAMADAPAPELALIAAEAAEQLGLLRARPRAGRGNAAGPQAPGVFSTLGPWRMPGLGA